MSHRDPRSAVVDLWADVPPLRLPSALIDAFARQDWQALKDEIRPLMDGLTTDASAYGRELLHIVRRLPVGVDSTLDRYHAMVALDFGDWDEVQACLATGSTEREEIEGIRDILLAPVGRAIDPKPGESYQWMLLAPMEYQFSQQVGRFKRWAHIAQEIRPIAQWARGDAPVGQHARYRQLQDVFFLALAEAQSGRLPVAAGLAREAQHLGNGWEPHRVIARDAERLVLSAMGDVDDAPLEVLDLSRSTAGPSPLGIWEMLTHLMPFIGARQEDLLGSAADLLEHAANGLASPRAHFQAHAWKIAALMLLGDQGGARELPALLTLARRASPGLRTLPQLLSAISTQRPEQFLEAARTARQTGNVWAQVAGLLWATALSPTRREGRRLNQVLEITGWRRAPLVPPEVASEAALGLVSLGLRGRAVVELAAVAGRPNVTLEVARRHLDEPLVRIEDKFHALEATAALGTTHAQDVLRRIAARRDEVGARAGVLLAKPSHPLGLSDREIEVIKMAGTGLTNRQIAEKLSLSPHTIARHLAN
ncbi:MAG TPA: helix-turn-helix transcriptional regulator, partial [Candidatus Krumholzibacteria bacterium]